MDYRAMVNPTYLTAKSTLLMLAGMGNEDAKLVIGALGTQDELGRNGDNGEKPGFPPEEFNALMTGVGTAVKARYEALSRLMSTEGYKSLFDIACGYTPRGLYCSEHGIDYVGLDVPVVAEEMQQAADKLGMDLGHPVYVGGDATNAASLTDAAEPLKNDLLISCEGLLQYLAGDEFEQFIGGIRQVLAAHGGAWVTSDLEVDYEAFATACMSSPDAVRMYNESRLHTMRSSNIYNEGVAHNWDKEKLLSFLTEHGFNVERLPFYHDDQGSDLLAGLPESWHNILLDKLRSSYLWKMTLSSNEAHEKIEGAKTVEDLEIDYAKEDGILKCRVKGRIDTISAPSLLEVFENNYDGISGVTVDAADLEYISSAGLRVLLMAVKKTGRVTVINTSDVVKEIFQTTGFDNMIEVQ